MLRNLSIKNYALIDELNVSFTKGFTSITGETGAGKSILLGGLSLVLGKRADLNALRRNDEKCIIEAEFEIAKYKLNDFFKIHDLDYEDATIIRREILPSGKSRAFINDTPITLAILSQLGKQLIDVHSQHETMQLATNDFQLKVVDALADNSSLLKNYEKQLISYKTISKELVDLLDSQESATKEHDYNSFLLQELESATLKLGMQEELEEQYEQLNNVENIIEQLATGHTLLNDEQIGILNLLNELKLVSSKLSNFGTQYKLLSERIQSVSIELDDIAVELQSFQDNVEANPQLLEEVGAKLQTLFDLQKKHHVSNVSDLLDIKAHLEEKVSVTENLDANIKAKEKELSETKQELQHLAKQLTDSRLKILPQLKKQLEESLVVLGMANASFKIEITRASDFKLNGVDDLTFLFSANKGADYGELKKVASGGELSRIMLSIKSILAKYEHLPTLMFDEIDTGVSGEISNKMGDIMLAMSKTMQIFSITHLPQVASKGDHHFKVYKIDENGVTHTRMKQLTVEERIVELAEMLGGKDVSDSALAHARQLLN